MSGHNKWSTIKHAKEKNDLQNAKIFTKIGREIAVAVKLGGADPNSNPKLKNLISSSMGEIKNIVYEECAEIEFICEDINSFSNYTIEEIGSEKIWK